MIRPRMWALAQGLAFGMILQLSVGPVCLAVLGEALTRGLRRALPMILAVALIDAAYIGVGATGVATLLRLESSRLILAVVGALVLIAFGARPLLARPRADAAVVPRSRAGAFGYGAILTAGNPLTILFWTGAFGSLVAAGRVRGTLEIASFGAGCVAATLLFLTGVAWAAARLAPLLRAPVLRWLDRAVGLLLVAFGLKLLLDVIR
jgi:threonine/homoserine/homoserine lactone efflux protein